MEMRILKTSLLFIRLGYVSPATATSYSGWSFVRLSVSGDSIAAARAKSRTPMNHA